MQNQTVRTFESSLFGSLITFVDENGAPWFVGKQVAEKLGYNTSRTNLNETLRRHCPNKSNVSELSSETLDVLPQGMRRNSAIISEADLYRLVMNSTLEGAEAFQDWVVREVLPSIRNHGGYSAEQPTMAEQYADPELFRMVNAQFEIMNANLNVLSSSISGQTAIIGMLLDSVRGLADNQTATAGPTEDEIPEGYKRSGQLFAEQRLSFGSNSFNANALKRLMDAVSWPTVRFNIFNSNGELVPVEHYKPNKEYRGRVMGLIEFLRTAISESTAIGTNQRRHPLIGTYYLS